jgi:hypothetical protein
LSTDQIGAVCAHALPTAEAKRMVAAAGLPARQACSRAVCTSWARRLASLSGRRMAYASAAVLPGVAQAGLFMVDDLHESADGRADDWTLQTAWLPQRCAPRAPGG